MDISHILTVGCSFTYCQNLPVYDAWPTKVALNLKTKLVNLGMPGVGNDHIHRITYEYLYKNLEYTNSKPLVIVAFTDPWRREAWVKNHHNDDNYNDFAPISYPHGKPETHHEYAMIENWDEEEFYRKTIICKLSLINLFQSLNIPYIFTDVFNQFPNATAHTEVIKKFKELTDRTSTKFYIDSIENLVKNHEALPCGHYSKDACVDIGNYLTESIKNLYPNLKFSTTIDYLRLSDFVKTNKYHQKFPQWCYFESKPAILLP